MNCKNSLASAYIRVLEHELIPALGCTEPIAIALAAALAQDRFPGRPERVIITASGNIIKNVKSVTVPNSGGLKGIPAAALLGMVAGDSKRELEVISRVTPDQQEQVKELLAADICRVELSKSNHPLDILVELRSKHHYAKVRIVDDHTNIALLERDGVVELEQEVSELDDFSADYSLLNVRDIVEFAASCPLEAVTPLLDRQIAYNMAIAEEGMRNPWGSCIGRLLLKSTSQPNEWMKMKAMAAAGADARMSGCDLPVIINSGSGNQGITASVPVIVYARERNLSPEQLYRALLLSNLITIHQKTGLGKLSAFCGAVLAGCATGAAVCYLNGGGAERIAHTIVNSLAIASGMVCDGAKPSCAAKISVAVEAGMIGFLMAEANVEFVDGEGIIKKGVENNISTVNRLGKIGMRETDMEILRIMLGE